MNSQEHAHDAKTEAPEAFDRLLALVRAAKDGHYPLPEPWGLPGFLLETLHAPLMAHCVHAGSAFSTAWVGRAIRDYLAGQALPMWTVLSDPAGQHYLNRCRELAEWATSAAVTTAEAEMRQDVTDMLASYGWDRPDVLELVNAPDALTAFQQDAIGSYMTLHYMAFLAGEPSEKPPRFSQTVYGVHRRSDAVQLLRRPDTADALYLFGVLDDERPAMSHWLWGIRSGGCIGLWTDMVASRNPLHRFLTRRPDKALEERWAKHRFPYKLLGIWQEREGSALRIDRPNSTTALARTNGPAVPIGRLSDIAPDEVLWAALVMREIQAGLYDPTVANAPVLVLRDDVRTPAAAGTALAVPDPHALVLPPTSTDLTPQDVTGMRLGRKSSGQHQWAVDLYGGPGRATLVSLSEEVMVTLPGTGVEVDPLEDFIGTPDEVANAQKWLARYRQAEQVRQAMEAEFARTKDDVLAWYTDHVLANRAYLLRAIGQGEWRVPCQVWDTEDAKFGPSPVPQERNALSFGDEPWTAAVVLGDPNPNQRRWGRMCAVRPSTRASMRAVFSPSTAEALALLCGCEVRELPAPLRHWKRASVYVGNQILDAMDPLDVLMAKTPWQALDWRVVVALSKSGLKQLQKAAAGGRPTSR